MAQNTANMAHAPESTGPSFQIHKLYLKEASFITHPEVTNVAQNWKPELHVELNVRHEALSQANTFEAILHVKSLVISQGNKVFEVEVDYAGIFTITQVEPSQLNHTLGSYCPSILYPYLREVMADLVLKAGFPQLNLAPINFDLLLEQQLKAQKSK